MARPKTPTAILELRNAGKKHPERMKARQNEPEPNPEIGSAPSYFTDEQLLVWDEIVNRCAPGVLTYADGVWVEICARLLWRYRTDPECPEGVVDKLGRFLGKTGMNPSERAGLVVPQQEEENPYKAAGF